MIYRLVKNEVSIAFFTGRLHYCGTIYGPLHNNGLLRVKQYEKSLSEFSNVYATDLVKRKLTSQINFVKKMKELKPVFTMTFERAEKLIGQILRKLDNKEINLESLRGFEGAASSVYFSSYCKIFPNSLKFRKRQKRPPRDPVNAMLSLCYTLLHYEFVREIQLIGLDPTIGFYHQFDYGRESLACDLVELFRVHVDEFVFQLFRDKTFTARDFMKDSDSGGVYLKKSGRKNFYPLYEEWANQHRAIWREEVQALARKLLEEKDTISY